MDILFVATELAPFAKSGGLADVMASLTKTLRQHGHKVTLALPRYRHFERAGLLVARRLTPLHFSLGSSNFTATVYDGRLPSGVDITLLDLPGLFDREGIYGEGAADYEDNPLRFAAFSRAVVELARQRLASNLTFDVIHCNDWTTALVPFFARLAPNDAVGSACRFVFTVHNLEFQGVVAAELRGSLGIPDEHFHPEGVEFYGKVNLLKTGLVFSDAITTVSETYAREIQTEALGNGLHGVLASRARKLLGIPNAVDYSLWNPTIDPAIVARYDAEDSSGKARCKTTLLSELQLDMVPERPIVAFCERLASQKGFDLLMDALPKLVRSDFALVIAGDGNPELVQRAQAAAVHSPGRVAFVHKPADPVLHRIVAGADIIVSPSRFEPCGQFQQYGQRYGAVPVGHATGGLVDTIVDCDAALETGTGFLFDEPSNASLAGALQRAFAAFASPRWPFLRRRIMRLDVGWDRSAYRYEQLYRSITA